MLANLLAVLPRVLLLPIFEAAVLSLFASPSTHCRYLLAGIPLQMGGSGRTNPEGPHGW